MTYLEALTTLSQRHRQQVSEQWSVAIEAVHPLGAGLRPTPEDEDGDTPWQVYVEAVVLDPSHDIYKARVEDSADLIAENVEDAIKLVIKAAGGEP